MTAPPTLSVVFCDDGVEDSANKFDKGETSSTYYFHRYKKRKFQMKRETNTISNIGKFVKREYVSTEMNCRQISVMVHPSANKLA